MACMRTSVAWITVAWITDLAITATVQFAWVRADDDTTKQGLPPASRAPAASCLPAAGLHYPLHLAIWPYRTARASAASLGLASGPAQRQSRRARGERRGYGLYGRRRASRISHLTSCTIGDWPLRRFGASIRCLLGAWGLARRRLTLGPRVFLPCLQVDRKDIEGCVAAAHDGNLLRMPIAKSNIL